MGNRNRVPLPALIAILAVLVVCIAFVVVEKMAIKNQTKDDLILTDGFVQPEIYDCKVNNQFEAVFCCDVKDDYKDKVNYLWLYRDKTHDDGLWTVANSKWGSHTNKLCVPITDYTKNYDYKCRISSIDGKYIYSNTVYIKNLKETNDVLVEMENRKNEISTEKGKETKAIMTIIDDDGKDSFAEKWKYCIENDIPVSCALITKKVGTPGYMGWNTIEELDNGSIEFLVHDTVHEDALTELSREELRKHYDGAKEDFIKHGLNPSYHVYPYGMNNDTVVETAREYFECAFGIGNPQHPVKGFTDNRYTLGRYTLTINKENEYVSFEEMKDKIDEAIDCDGWLVWMTHCYYAGFDEEQIRIITDGIEYAMSRGVRILNVHDAMDERFYNINVVR